MDRLIKLLQHVISVTEVEECGSVVRVQLDCLLVAFNRLVKILRYAKCIAKVVVAFSLGWILVDCFLVVLNCELCLLKEIISVSKVVMDFRQVVVGLEGFFEVAHRLFELR